MTSVNSSITNVKDLAFINNFKSMAVIGSSKKRNFFFLRNHLESFKGEIYAVHPTVKKIPGFDDGTEGRIFASVKDIPGDVDFVFITVPASNVLDVISDCAEKGVKLASIFTAEFSDSGTEEGRALEKELIKRARNKVRILGPNGLGLFYPKLGIAWRTKFPTGAGNIGFIAQSGGICNIAIYTAKEIGIKFSKVFSFGNGADVDFVDIINFLCNDPETEMILCYVEGIKEERIEVLKTILLHNNKPIVILKGGQTETGSIAAKTHTASISGENRIWKAFFKQYNLIEVDSLEQLINTARLVEFYGIKDIQNVVVFSISGGYGVLLVDLIEKAGMSVPPFSPEIQEQLNEKLFIHGTSPKNPLDIAAQIRYPESIKEIIDIALSDKKIDALIMDFPSWYFSFNFFSNPDNIFETTILEALNLGHKYNKPLIPIIQRANCPDDQARISRILAKSKVPVFGDPIEVIPLLPKISTLASNKKKNLN